MNPEELIRDISKMEREILDLAAKGASNAMLQPLLDVMAFKTRELLFPFFHQYTLLTEQ